MAMIKSNKAPTARYYERYGIKLVSAPLSLNEVAALQKIAEARGLALTRCASEIIREVLERLDV